MQTRVPPCDPVIMWGLLTWYDPNGHMVSTMIIVWGTQSMVNMWSGLRISVVVHTTLRTHKKPRFPKKINLTHPDFTILCYFPYMYDLSPQLIQISFNWFEKYIWNHRKSQSHRKFSGTVYHFWVDSMDRGLDSRPRGPIHSINMHT